jgi:hypothetical protein
LNEAPQKPLAACALPDLGPRGLGAYVRRPLREGDIIRLTWDGPTFTVARSNLGSATVTRATKPKQRRAWSNKKEEFVEWEVAGRETSNISAYSFVYPGVVETWTEVNP